MEFASLCWGWVENDIVTYNMDSRKVHVILTYYIPYRRDILPEIIDRHYYLPYVSLFTELESLAK